MPPSEDQANSCAAAEDRPAQAVQNPRPKLGQSEWHGGRTCSRTAVPCRMTSIGRWSWACSRLQAHRRAWLAVLILLACQAAADTQPDNRFLQAPRMRAKESRWWAWAPHISLQGGQVMPQEVCVGDAYIDKFIVSTGTATVDANSTRAFRARGILSVQGRCSDGRQLGYYGPLPSDTSVAYEQENIVVTQPDGFAALNGTGTGFLEVLLDVGSIGGSVTSSWLTPCPAGSRVDGYQIVNGGLIYQIRPRCSCVNCGCACLPEWNYTSIQGNHFHITSGCANPDNESALPWCPVDPTTCTHTPAAMSGRIDWDYCYNLDDKVSIDTERTSNRCNCQPSWSETTIKGQTVGSGGGCSDDIPADDTPGWCYVIPETCTSPPQRRHGIPWDVCISAKAQLAAERTATSSGGINWDTGANITEIPSQWNLTSPDPGSGPLAPLNTSTSGCKCLAQWSETSMTTGDTLIHNGTCAASPWNTSSLPWCKVDARTCQYPTRQGKVYSKGPFNLCLAQNDTKTVDTQITVEGCNCLQEWKYTDPLTGLYMEVRNGSCAKTGIGELPWCYVDPKTCVGQPLLRNGYYWDNCFPNGQYQANVAPAQANATVPVQNLDMSRPSGDLAKLAAKLEVAFGGPQWTPAVSNGFSQLLYLFMAGVQDSFQDPLSNSLQSVAVDSATLVGPANRRLLQQLGGTAAHQRRLMAGNYSMYNVALQIGCNSTAVQRVADALSIVASNPANLAHLQSQGIDVRSVRVVSFLQQPAGTSVTTQVWGAPAAAPAPAASPPGVDMATVGKGVGIAVAGLIAICLCLTVTILELMKLKREAQVEAAAKEEAAKNGTTGHSFHNQDSDEFWMYDELKTRVVDPHTLRNKYVNGTVKDKDSDKMIASRSAFGEDPSLVSQMSRDSGMSMNSLQTGYSGDTGSLPSSLMGAHNDWEIAPMDIEILRREDGSPWELGAGAFGKVYKGLWNEVQDVAVKMVVGQSAEQQARFLREIAILKDCRNVHVVQFLGACMHPGCTMLITELMSANAQDLIHSGQLTWRHKGKQVALDSARGLAYLHRKRIAWLDCKSSNVLLTKEGTAKVADVGLAHVVHASHIAELDALGTFAYAAPELINGDKCNEKADIWSFGVLLHELITAEIPRRGKLRELTVPEDCTYEEAQLVRDCLQNEPDERPSAKDLVNRLAGATSRPNSMLLRGSGSASAGHISGQLLADGRGVKELMSRGPMSLSALREQDRISRDRLSSRERLSKSRETSQTKSDVRIPIPPPE